MKKIIFFILLLSFSIAKSEFNYSNYRYADYLQTKSLLESVFPMEEGVISNCNTYSIEPRDAYELGVANPLIGESELKEPGFRFVMAYQELLQCVAQKSLSYSGKNSKYFVSQILHINLSDSEATEYLNVRWIELDDEKRNYIFRHVFYNFFASHEYYQYVGGQFSFEELREMSFAQIQDTESVKQVIIKFMISFAMMDEFLIF